MGFIDLILYPLYVFLFHLIFLSRRKRIEDPVLKKYHRRGFWIKVVGTLAFSLYHGVISPGNDSVVLYYAEGLNMAKLISADASNLKMLFLPGADFDETLLSNPYNSGYFGSEGNYLITKLVAVLCFFSFRNYLIINLFFSMISYSGVWRLFRFFYEQYPHLHKKLAIAILYLPSFVFWSSGLLKDPICTGMLGWMTYALYCAFYKKVDITKNLFIAMVSGYIIAIVKSYILLSYIPFFILFLLLSSLKLLKSKGWKIITTICVILLIVVSFFFTVNKLEDGLGSFALSKIGETVKSQQSAFINMADMAESSFSLGRDFDGSNLGLLKLAPAAINATLFRPYLWESKKISTLLSSLESLILMIFTFYVLLKGKIINFIRPIFGEPIILFCFCFSIVFGVFVGATALNFGTLVRYKIPCMPFFVIALVLIDERIRQKKNIEVEERKRVTTE